MVSRPGQLKDQRQSESCRAKQAEGKMVKASLKTMRDFLDEQIAAVRKAIDAAIAADPLLARNATLLRACKGIGPQTAPAILAFLPEIGTLNRRRIAALVGAAPIRRRGGSSLNCARIEGGRKHLRDILFMAARAASHHNPTCKTFRDRLRANRKPHKVTLVALARKLVATHNAIIKSQKPFKTA
jgi:transposase